jgi:hypothetical protein
LKTDDLLKFARSETRAKSITAAVNQVLEEWARYKRIERMKEQAGKLHFDGNLKELRGLELKKADRLYIKRSR